MNDCLNAEMRDQLPDLLHERLDAAARAAVMAHVDGCADCRDELELLRVARGTLIRATPHVDLNFIIEAIPQTAPMTRTVTVPRRPRWADWRIAAAAVLLVAGGSSVSLLGRQGGVATRDTVVTEGTPAVQTSAAVPRPNGAVATSRPAPQTEVIAEVPTDVSEPSGLSSSRLGDLNENQLKALLTEIDQLQPTPITEPDPVTLRVDTKGTTSPEGL